MRIVYKIKKCWKACPFFIDKDSGIESPFCGYYDKDLSLFLNKEQSEEKTKPDFCKIVEATLVKAK